MDRQTYIIWPGITGTIVEQVSPGRVLVRYSAPFMGCNEGMHNPAALGFGATVVAA